MKALFTTRPSLGLTVLRLAMAAVMVYHGGQKLGYFGGFGLEGTLGFLLEWEFLHTLPTS